MFISALSVLSAGARRADDVPSTSRPQEESEESEPEPPQAQGKGKHPIIMSESDSDCSIVFQSKRSKIISKGDSPSTSKSDTESDQSVVYLSKWRKLDSNEVFFPSRKLKSFLRHHHYPQQETEDEDIASLSEPQTCTEEEKMKLTTAVSYLRSIHVPEDCVESFNTVITVVHGRDEVTTESNEDNVGVQNVESDTSEESSKESKVDVEAALKEYEEWCEEHNRL